MEQFHDLGLRLQEAIAGFAGGVTYVFVTKNTKPMEAVGCVLVGTFTANYLSESVASVSGLGQGPAGFVTGLCAMAICQGILAAARKGRFPSGSAEK